MYIQPDLNFNGRGDEALEFYKKAVGAEVTTLLRFKDAPDKSMISPGSENKVMHSSFRIGDTVMNASDGRCTGKTDFEGINLSLHTKNADEAAKMFKNLSEGGQVQMPLAKTFFSESFGMLADRFGVMWMVLVAPAR
jgi:PhnB protein